DPWNSLEETFPVGSIHEGTVTRKDDKGAVVQLPYGLEGFAPARHLRMEDEKVISIDQIAPFMVIEFDRNDKKIILSHSRIWEQVKTDEKNAQMKEQRADAENTKKAVKTIQSKVEKTTLGDLGVLADLKKKMDNEEDAAPKKKVVAEKPEVEINKGPVVNKIVSEEIKADKTGEGDADLLIEKEDSSLIAEAKANSSAEEKKESKEEDVAEDVGSEAPEDADSITSENADSATSEKEIEK
ncbi:MAG: S1 RNA-binding domain-containing protein, partial [Ginsengibacter sp.]